MLHRMRIFALAALAAACQSGSQDIAAIAQSQDARSQAVELTVRLIELTENPTPVGLPTSLVVNATGLPRAGERVAVTWRAVDGEAEPRQGSGTLEVDHQQKLIATLTAPGRAPADVLILSGTNSSGTVRGTFSDRLFFRRAGRFEGQIR